MPEPTTSPNERAPAAPPGEEDPVAALAARLWLGRVGVLRVVGSELHRICDHLTLVAAMGLELGAMTVLIYAMEARDPRGDRLTERRGGRPPPSGSRWTSTG